MSARWKIPNQLSQVAEASWADQDRIKQLRMDVGILEKFLGVIEPMTYIDGEATKESMEPLTSVTRSLEGLWPEDFTLLSLLLERMGGTSETCPIDVFIRDFDSIMLELEGIILQSKQIVDGWCRNSIHSLMMQCKPSKSQQELIVYLLREIPEKLVLLSNKQIDVLRAKIDFLHFLLFQEGKEINEEFLIFIGHLAYGAACLTFLYWANKDDDDTASVRFGMLHKFIPYSYHLTPLYVAIFKSNDLQPVSKYNLPLLYLGSLNSNDPQPISDSFLLGEEVVESFVDFFFDHLAIVLEDGFLFLRDRLMFLFTFLINPPCQIDIAEEEGDLIRSQIYAILHQDVYLLLSFDEMNKDLLCDKKALFSAFMIRIDIVNAKIRQLYRGSSSASWITLEVEKMEYNYFVSLRRELSSVEKHAEGAVVEQIQLYKWELRFLRVFLLWLATWDDTDEEIKVTLRSIITCFLGIWGEKEEEEGLLAHRLHAIRTGSITDWHPLAFELQGNIQQSKLETEAWCINLFHSSSFQSKTSTSYKILEFLDLNDLVNCKVSEIAPFKKQIEALEEKLIFLKNFLKLAMNCTCYDKLEEFKMFVQAFANDAACLTFIYWAKDTNAKSANETDCILSHMLRKVKPTTPNVARLYFETLVAIYVQRSDSHMFGQTAFSFVQLFLEDLVTHLKDDDFQILQDNVVFLLTFLNDPHNQNSEESICSQIDVLFWEGLYRLIPFDDIKEGSSNKNVLLSEFMTKIEAINAKIICIYGKFPDSSLYNFPKVISPQFLDFLLQNLRNLKDRMNIDRKYAPFAKYKIIKIEKELTSLHPLFIHIFDTQSELNEIWFEVVNVLHLTEHVFMSCISSWFVFDHPIWYHIAYLLHVYEEIKVVKAKLEKVKLENIINNARCLPSSVGFISEPLEHGRPSEINENFVGFEDEKEKIIDMLTCGPKSLDIVSIVGMGGLGKTTLARKVFGSSSVKSHFNVVAFCSVSPDHNTRRMLHDIIRDVKGVDETKDDLAHELHKCLSRKKYLIVLDDIWNVSAWNEVKSSFPDHENGSRVMFTTRSHEVADKCKINCSPHQLRFLNEVESWELLQKKVFRNDISPAYDLYEIGKQIAKNCKGLALAVVVIGGLLARTEKSVRWWSDVEGRLVDYLSEEGCMKILELSYKHLAENLNPCLIYLGAFPKDRLTSVKHVILLWIAEGFVQETNTKSLEDVAQEYFHDLVDRSFIIVGARSSGGGIKTFRVHDLIHDLCQTKCRDGNFFQLNHETESPSSSLDASINNHYRVSTLKESDVTIADGSSHSNARTVHFFLDHGYYKECDFPLRTFRLGQVLDLGTLAWKGNGVNQLTSLVHLRYIDAILRRNSIPSSISNLWNITCLRLKLFFKSGRYIHLPETFWRLKSLRHVNAMGCILEFPGDENLSSDQIMDKVVSFSKPILSTGKDVKRLLQRLPVVRKMSCFLEKSHVYDEGSIETLDFYRELESLMLTQTETQAQYPAESLERRQYMIKFPSTLKKLTLERFLLPRTALSAIAELHCLEVLKLRSSSFLEPTLETEDLVFRNLKFFQLVGNDLVEWNASVGTFPCLEQLVIHGCGELKEFPPCFEEMSTLKRIVVRYSPGTESSAFKIQEELMELGIQLEVSIL